MHAPRGLLVPILAGLAFATSARADDKQKEKSFEKEITTKVKMNYLLYLPKDYESSGDKKWPLVLFLHGAGERGDDLAMVKKNGPPKLVDKGKDFPFILVSPQAGGRGGPRGWNAETLNALLDEVVAKHRVDKDRIYLTGLSMGGFGTWTLAAAHPEKFAAIAPICGGGNPRQAEKLKDLPIWIFHGAKDNTVPIARSEDMVKALQGGQGPRGQVHRLPGRRARLVDRDLQQPRLLRLAPGAQAEGLVRPDRPGQVVYWSTRKLARFSRTQSIVSARAWSSEYFGSQPHNSRASFVPASRRPTSLAAGRMR